MQHRTGENPTGCPFCSNQRVLVGYNDLQTRYPELAKQWEITQRKVAIYCKKEKNDILILQQGGEQCGKKKDPKSI